MERNNDINQGLIAIYNQTSLFHLKCIPLFGIYGEEYIIMSPISIIRSYKKPQNLPILLQCQLDSFNILQQNITIEFFHITLDASEVYAYSNQSKTGYEFSRINMLAHSYVFYNVQSNKEHKSIILPSIFTDKNYHSSFIQDTYEQDGLRVNPHNLIDNELRRQIILHPHNNDSSMTALSPNNCAVLFNLNNQLIHFYLVVFGTYNGTICKCSIIEYIILPTTYKSNLFSTFNQQMLSNKSLDGIAISLYYMKDLYSDYFKNIFSYFFIDMAKVIDKNEFILLFNRAIEIIFGRKESYCKNEMNAREMNSISNYYYGELISYLNAIHLQDKTTFGEEYLKEHCSCEGINESYLVELLQKWLTDHLDWVSNVFQSFLAFIGVDNEGIKLIHDEEDSNYMYMAQALLEQWILTIGTTKEIFVSRLKEVKSKRKVDNRNIPKLKRIANEILNNKHTNVNILLGELDKQIERLFYYNVWVMKGKHQGIHHNFGKLSFDQSKELGAHYHCNNDEKYLIVKNYIDFLESIDKK